MFTGQKESDQYIYHYTKAETAIEFILENKNLRLSPFAKTNDPKETKDWFFIPGTNQGRNLDKYTPEYLSKVLNPTLKQKTNLLCFSTDKNLTGNHLTDMPNRGFCKPRMWAQYGGNHTGVCLIFDTLQFSDIFYEQFSNKDCSSGMVNYQDRLID
ncbi:DUF2971 domain-containing protein [Deefgea tanakiae]|uniref:DUF2971 domain-containing protein n=1 Tax=Deefgea tanakiae TaxID=2865840 RepID=A0ABX8Z5L8_9NEIS|nr:DUF2971 domain-containing protein [Deefgea tanakiae]QZA77868.1 DUF2971 domain-containing protein [Deefgea tanakiae]